MMNRSEHRTHGDMANDTPLFASNLLALFYELRENYNDRQVTTDTADNTLQAEEE